MLNTKLGIMGEVDVKSFDAKMAEVKFVNIICNTILNDKVNDKIKQLNRLPNLLR